MSLKITFARGRRFLIDWVWFLFDSFVLWSSPGQKKPTPDVAILRMDAIGDFVLSSGHLGSMIQHYRSAGSSVMLVVSSEARDVAKQYFHESCSQILDINRPRFMRSPIYRYKILQNLNCLMPKLAIHFVQSRLFGFSDTLLRALNASEKVGSVGDLANQQALQKQVSDRWYTRLLPDPNPGSHDLLRQKEFLSALFGKEARLCPPLPVPNLPNLSITSAPADLLIVAPSASWVKKRWPLRQFVEVARQVTANGRWETLWIGGPSDQSLAKELLELGIPSQQIRIGKTSIVETAALISKASLVLTNDSAAAHFAAASKTKCVVVLGGGHFGRFFPYPEEVGAARPKAVYRKMDCFNCDWFCHQPSETNSPVPCLQAVTTEAVLSACLQAQREV